MDRLTKAQGERAGDVVLVAAVRSSLFARAVIPSEDVSPSRGTCCLRELRGLATFLANPV